MSVCLLGRSFVVAKTDDPTAMPFWGRIDRVQGTVYQMEVHTGITWRISLIDLSLGDVGWCHLVLCLPRRGGIKRYRDPSVCPCMSVYVCVSVGHSHDPYCAKAVEPTEMPLWM